MKSLWRFSILFIFLFFYASCSKEKRADIAAEKMCDFVSSISSYARQFDPDFIIIPQNGCELAFNSQDPADGMNGSYLDAISAFGIEELFYDGSLSVDQERLSMLCELRKLKQVMVADYVSDNAGIPDVIQRNLNEGFICFPRVSSNYDYTQIPDTAIHENGADIHTMQDARNYLYLISSKNFNSKREMIDSIREINFDVILIDLFFENEAFTNTEIGQLKIKANGGTRLVISYINVGAAESYRYYWKDDWRLHNPNWLKKPYEGYEDEIWVKFWKPDWQDIIFGNEDSYIKRIINAGFDGAYLDNVEVYYFLYFD
ncbi:MAG: hypothetical protein FJY10_05050 [Bacteroidetes bacterium]|nr:hypothetical protein [Bacteroidota bacterium]